MCGGCVTGLVGPGVGVRCWGQVLGCCLCVEGDVCGCGCVTGLGGPGVVVRCWGQVLGSGAQVLGSGVGVLPVC